MEHKNGPMNTPLGLYVIYVRATLTGVCLPSHYILALDISCLTGSHNKAHTPPLSGILGLEPSMMIRFHRPLARVQAICGAKAVFACGRHAYLICMLKQHATQCPQSHLSLWWGLVSA